MVTAKLPLAAVQPIASPQLVRVAATVAVPGAPAVNLAVAVPHPWPGTQPDTCGEIVGGPAPDNTDASELGPIVQYVLLSVRVTRSPRWTSIVFPLSSFVTVTVGAPSTTFRGALVTAVRELVVDARDVVDDGDAQAVTATASHRAAMPLRGRAGRRVEPRITRPSSHDRHLLVGGTSPRRGWTRSVDGTRFQV